MKVKSLPPIRFFLIFLNLALLLSFAGVSLLLWQQIEDNRKSGLQQEIESAHETMRASSASLVRSMALSANQALAGYDFGFLNTLMQQVAAEDEEIQYCQMISRNGQVVAHNDPLQLGKRPQGKWDRYALQLMEERLGPGSGRGDIVHVKQKTAKQAGYEGLLEVVSAVYSGQQQWGVLRCGFSMQRLSDNIELRVEEWDRHFARVRYVYLGTVAAFLVLGLIVAMLVTRRFLKALDRLSSGVVQVSDGTLGQQLSMDDLMCAEFASLATSFNQMTTNLAVTHRELDETNRSLEQKVAERTQELQRSNKELEAFNYSVSHDLRAPLRSIGGFSQALAEDYGDKLDDIAMDYLSRVQAASNRMDVLIDDLLKLSRLSRREMRVEAVDLSSLAHQVFDKLQEEDTERQVLTQVQPGLTADGDSNLLLIVLENLLGNAWKYTGKVEQGRIEFGSEKQSGRIVFYVRDNGVGFDMRYADKLFGAFQRLHKSSEFEGSGIGLATVSRIIHRHGGKVWAESAIDKGAAFYFELPQ